MIDGDASIAAWTVGVLFPAVVVLVIISALIERSGPIRLRHWAEKAGGRLLVLYAARQRFEAFRFLLSLLARLGPVAFAGALWILLGRLDVPGALWIAPVVVVALVALIEFLNRYLVEHHAEASLRQTTIPLRLLAFLLLPIVWVVAPFVALAGASEEEDEDEASDDEIEAYIDVGVREGILEPEEEELVRSIVDFGDTQVKSVMTPRVEMVSAPVEADPEEICRRFFESKHARLPLYRESTDHIEGILHIRDLFEAMQGAGEVEVEKLANSPLYVPESKPLRDLLTEMQMLHQQMAIVVDEYGGVAGLVTVEDLVEEIVGEISDEHEPHETEREELAEGRWRLPGRTDVEDLEELFDIDADEMPYETVSGLICGELGQVPKAGDVVEIHGLVFTIEEADERRVMSVAVHRPLAEESATSVKPPAPR